MPYFYCIMHLTSGLKRACWTGLKVDVIPECEVRKDLLGASHKSASQSWLIANLGVIGRCDHFNVKLLHYEPFWYSKLVGIKKWNEIMETKIILLVAKKKKEMWRTSWENRPWGLYHCHTKRRMGALGRAHPSLRMTPTTEYNLWRQ